MLHIFHVSNVHIFHVSILSFGALFIQAPSSSALSFSSSSSSWLLTADDSRPVFIKAGCDRNHPKVDFCPYDNPALTRLDRLLGLFFIAQKLLKWIQCRSDVILASSVSSFVSWQVMAFSGSLVERHASEL